MRETFIITAALVVFAGPILLGIVTAPVEYTQPEPADNGDWAEKTIDRLFE